MSEISDLLRERIDALLAAVEEHAKTGGREGLLLAADVTSHIAEATAAGAEDLEKIIDLEEHTVAAFGARKAVETMDIADAQMAESLRLLIEKTVAVIAIAI